MDSRPLHQDPEQKDKSRNPKDQNSTSEEVAGSRPAGEAPAVAPSSPPERRSPGTSDPDIKVLREDRTGHAPWGAVMLRLKKALGTDFDIWFKPTRALSLENNRLTVKVPNSTFRDWLTEEYTALVESIFGDLELDGIELVYTEKEPQKSKDTRRISLPFDDPTTPRRLVGLNPYYTFESFVVGSSNEFARAAAVAAAENPGQAYNPLFIYGGVGLGKTHILHAIGNFVAQAMPQKSVRYVTTETFVNELIRAIRHKTWDDFRDDYRTADVLLIDDIQFLAGKEQTQEEFFHTFNHLHEAGKQIVLTSDSLPSDIPRLEERLHSRFSWGLTADIKAPNLETRVAILKRKATDKKYDLPDETALLIAHRVKKNIRELEGLLNYLFAQASLRKTVLTTAFARDLINDRHGAEDQPILLRDIMKFTAERYKISAKKIREKTNAHYVSFPRHVAMYLSRELTDESFPSIGRAFGFDHASVVYASKKIADKMEKDPSFKKEIEACLEALRKN